MLREEPPQAIGGQVLQMRLVVEVNDLEAAVLFYRDQLGLSEILDLESANGARVVILEAGRATLELVNPAQQLLIDDLEVGRQVSPELRIAFQVDDVHATTRRLTDAGAQLVAEPVETPWRSLNSRLEGSAGLHLTVFEELDEDTSVTLRGLRPGDLGWIVERHGALYAAEYEWYLDFEALVATIVARYQQYLQPERENAWIAEVDGVRAGCVLCTAKDEGTAQLRLLLVEPWARGRGIGTRLIDACISYARGAGYREMILWTNDVLVDARKLYETAGFTLESESIHYSFGHELVGQIWWLEL